MNLSKDYKKKKKLLKTAGIKSYKSLFDNVL